MSSAMPNHVACPACHYRGFEVLPQSEYPEGVEHAPNALVVKCSACGQRYRIQWEGQVRLAPSSGNAGYDASHLEPGDVLRLEADMGEIPAGLWAVVETGWIMRLARCYENEDGALAMTHWQVTVTQQEAGQFAPMQLRVELPLAAEKHDTP